MEKQQLSFIAIILITIIFTSTFVIYKLDSMKSNGPSPTPPPTLWPISIEHPATYLTTDDEKVFITDDTGNVRCFDSQNGKTLWNASVGEYVVHFYRSHQIVIIKNRVYIAYENARVSCFDKNNGTHLWTIQNAMNDPQYYRHPPSITFEDDLMYVKTDGISARDATTGELLWEVNPFLKRFDDSQTSVYLLGGNFLDDEFVYTAGDDFSNMHFIKINIKNGNIVWRSNVTWDGSMFALGGFIPSVVANVQGRTIISVMYQGVSEANQFICLDSTSGEELWNIKVGKDATTPFVFGSTVYNELFLFAKADGYLYAVNLVNGTVEWKTKVDTQNLFSYNNYVQIPSIQIDVQNQRLFWYLNAAESGPSNNYTGTLCNLNLSNGNVNWIKHLKTENGSYGGSIWHTTSLAFNNDVNKVFLTKNKGLWIFNSMTGDLIQSDQFEHYVIPPVFQGSETFVAADLSLFVIPKQDK